MSSSDHFDRPRFAEPKIASQVAEILFLMERGGNPNFALYNTLGVYRDPVSPAAVENDSVRYVKIWGPICDRREPLLDHVGIAHTSLEEVTYQLTRGLGRDKELKTIVLDIDSGGGSPPQALCFLIEQLKEFYEVVALCRGYALSAAFWIASVASKILASSYTDEFGSIGALCQIKSPAMKENSCSVSEFVAGELKASSSAYRPMTPERETSILEGLRDLQYRFIEDIARNRKMDIEKVAALASGRTFSTMQAYEAGLIDGLFCQLTWHTKGIVKALPVNYFTGDKIEK